MLKTSCLLFLIFLSLFGKSQSLDGTYVALELINFKADTSGTVSFYGYENFPDEVWFHEVKMVIRGRKIHIQKSPVHFDSMEFKRYSASDGGFLTYNGTITKVKDIYIARTKLVAHDYIGFSLFTPPKIIIDQERKADTSAAGSENPTSKPSKKYSVKELRKRHDVVKGLQGIEVFLPKGSTQQEFVIRVDIEGVWMNNKFYSRIGGEVNN
jgi:hypothetical protein